MTRVIADARLSDGRRVDVVIDGSVITEVMPRSVGTDPAGTPAAILPAAGGLLLPAFIDTHVHLDKALTRDLLVEHDGTLASAIAAVHLAKRRYTVDDVRRRARAVIESSVLTGTTRLRSHVDVDTIGGLTPLEGVLAASRDCAAIADVRVIAFPQEGIVRDPGTAELMREAMATGAHVVGGIPHWELDIDAQREHVRICFDIAAEFDADVDMHVDESDDGAVQTLALVVAETERRRWHGRVVAGHLCALSASDQAYADEVIAGCVRTGLGVVSNPVTNLAIQGRGDRGLIRRGTTRVGEFLAAGVPVAFGQDCVADGFYPFGRGDMLEVALISAHAAHLTTEAELATLLAGVTDVPATMWHLADYGIRAGASADLQLYAGSTWPQVLRAQEPPTHVWRAGRLVARTILTRTLLA